MRVLVRVACVCVCVCVHMRVCMYISKLYVGMCSICMCVCAYSCMDVRMYVYIEDMERRAELSFLEDPGSR